MLLHIDFTFRKLLSNELMWHMDWYIFNVTSILKQHTKSFEFFYIWKESLRKVYVFWKRTFLIGSILISVFCVLTCLFTPRVLQFMSLQYGGLIKVTEISFWKSYIFTKKWFFICFLFIHICHMLLHFSSSNYFVLI